MNYTAEQVESHIACLEARDMHAEAGILRQYAALLRERESAKAAVTDEMALKANYIYASYVGGGIESMRAALEAVAPMLASARSSCHLRDCTGDIHDQTGEWRGECPYCKPASARVPDEKEDLDPVRLRREGRVATEWERGFNEGWNDCRETMLAAAGEPNHDA